VRASDGMGRISFNNMPGHKPVEQHANRGQVLFTEGGESPCKDTAWGCLEEKWTLFQSRP